MLLIHGSFPVMNAGPAFAEGVGVINFSGNSIQDLILFRGGGNIENPGPEVTIVEVFP